MIEHPEVPNLRHLRMLQTVGRLGSFSRASREVNTSQPAVTQAIAKIEEQLGAPLFQRGAAGTFPTDCGRLFLRRVDRFFEIMDSAIERAEGRRRHDTAATRRAIEHMITGTHVRSLIAVAESEVLDRSAEHLGVSPTSLFRSVRDLEHVLGAALFDRNATGLVCNALGRDLTEYFCRALREIELGRSEIRLAANNEDPEIRLGVLPMAGSYELATAVRNFVAQRPSARVVITNGDYPRLLRDLRQCRIDMIYGLLRRPDWVTDVDEQAFFRDSFCIATRPGHPLTRNGDITPLELAKFDWIVPAEGTPRRGQIDRLFATLENKPRLGIETSSSVTMRALLAHSDLVTLMTRSEIWFDVDAGILASLDCAHLEPIPPKGITTRSDWLPTDAHRAFVDVLQQSTRQPFRHYGDDVQVFDAIA